MSNGRGGKVPDPVPSKRKKSSPRKELLEQLGPPPSLPPLGGPPTGSRPRILLVDDEESFLDATRATCDAFELQSHARIEFFLFEAKAYEDLVEKLNRSIEDRDFFTTVYIDMNLKGGGQDAGIGLIRRLRKDIPKAKYIPFVAITAYPDPQREREARETGAIRFIIKTSRSASDNVFGTFVHRLISEAQETLEQCEDQLWADAASMLAEKLRINEKPNTWQDACRSVLDFIDDHFNVTGLYVRSLETPTILTEEVVKDGLKINESEIDTRNVPFLNDFISPDNHEPYRLIEKLEKGDVGRKYAKRVAGHHAALARIGVENETFGLLTMYRKPTERAFRRRDGEGLSRLASLLAASMAYKRLLDAEAERAQTLRSWQKALLEQIRRFDDETSELGIWEKLRDALFDSFESIVPNAQETLKVTVRMIDPGSNMARRACPPRGYVPIGKAPPISIEDYQGSSVARAIWDGKSKIYPSLDFDVHRHEFLFRDQGIQSALTVPAIAQGICVGAVNLECLLPNMFSEKDQEFVELMVEAAAASILRLRHLHLLEEMADVTTMLRTPRQVPTNDIIDHVLGLLFSFSGCSEIFMLTPPEGETSGAAPWRLQSVFQCKSDTKDTLGTVIRDSSPTIIELKEEAAEKWRDQVFTNWRSSFLFKVFTSGRNIDWTEDEREIVLTDEGLPGRDDEKKTRTQTVIVFRPEPSDPPEALVSLLFPRRRVISGSQVQILNHWGTFLAWLFRHQSEVTRILGEQMINEQEARLGQVYGQMRHSTIGKLSLIRQNLRNVEEDLISWSDASVSIIRLLTEAERDFRKTKSMIKVVSLANCDLGTVWNDVRAELAGVAEEKGGIIIENQLKSHSLVTDEEIVRTILYNLVDNALRHGGKGTETSARAIERDGRMIITVSDTGSGIVASAKERLFQPANTTGSSSSGLGLYLTRLRTEDLGGTLELIKTGPTGTEFEITLPLRTH